MNDLVSANYMRPPHIQVGCLNKSTQSDAGFFPFVHCSQFYDKPNLGNATCIPVTCLNCFNENIMANHLNSSGQYVFPSLVHEDTPLVSWNV